MDQKQTGKSSTITLTKEKAAAILTLFIFCLVAVGLLAGLVKPTCKSSSKQPIQPTPAPPTDPTSEPWKNHRLPNHLIPIHYNLTLHPDFYGANGGPGRFSGKVMIWINVTKQATHHLLVHVKKLDVENVNCFATSWPPPATGSELRSSLACRSFLYEPNEYLVIELINTKVQPNTFVELEIDFVGSLTNGITGIYRSQYKDDISNSTRYIVSTKFQPTDARRAFPCLDEPMFKSTYNVTLIHDRHFTALSNMPVLLNQSLSNGLTATTFQESVPMVTYLVCFVVGQLAYKENFTQSGIPFRVYSVPGKVSQVDYALDIGIRVLNKFEELFGLPYPLPKLDQIAIPDFFSGAMENWGLITYREVNLLFDSREASAENQQRVAAVISHELAHMWFGNLVTMEWWDDLWLNEGFASYVEYLGVDHVHPDWDMNSQFLVEDLQLVFTIDSVVSSHPIVVPVAYPSQIGEVFDTISYSKGASVLRMLEKFMGMDNFKRGLQGYMRQHQYKTTVTDDLWTALSKVDGAEIKRLMDTWTRQMGFPVVTVVVTDSNEIELRQQRFLLDPNADKTQPPSNYSYIWRVPITFRTSRGFNGSFLLDRAEGKVTLPFNFNPATDWIKCNADESGYYRHNYMATNWQALIAAVTNNHLVMSASDRAGLIDNAFNLARASLVEYKIPLQLSLYLVNETHYTPWETFYKATSYIRKMLSSTVHYGNWQRYVRRLVGPIFRRLDLSTTARSHLDRLLTPTMIHLACGTDEPLCLQNVSRIFFDWLDNGRPIMPDVRGAVYTYAMRQTSDEVVWGKVWSRYQASTIPQEKMRLLYALSQTRAPWLLTRLLEYTKDESKIREQDTFIAIMNVARNPIGQPIVWNWLRTNWERIVAKYSVNNRQLGRTVAVFVSDFDSPILLDEVQSFFRQYPDAGAGARGRVQAVEQIRANIAWVQRTSVAIADWLRNYVI